MKSLAVVVGLIFLTALFSGPFAFALSFVPDGRFLTRTVKKVLVSILCFFASTSGALLMVSSVAFPIRILGLVGISFASLSIFRVFQPEPKNRGFED